MIFSGARGQKRFVCALKGGCALRTLLKPFACLTPPEYSL